ncbi:hypothetical protein CXB51_007622 [Gossypium anomalum]|uniref:Uncharacterized protein n=1 Tax=Gossypium anomalum TaxID=47600 RepID=A0A8J5YUN3_9ROSI|nr:hypothetical protein CXB51_007622 [Gossypium anomalum]
MQKMSSDDGIYHHHHSDKEALGTDKVPHIGPLSGSLNKRAGRKGSRFNLPGSSSSKGDDYVEITLDVGDDSVAVHSLKAANGDDLQDDPELTLLAKGLEKKSSVGSSMVRNASAKIKQVGQELKRLTSLSKKPARFDRTKSAVAHALKGLKFISKTDGGHGWVAVEKLFDEISASNNGVLPRSRFGECIGMESKEFAGQLFDALARKRNLQFDSIDKAHLKEFWDQISNQSFDARLQTFFDMVDKDADGRITEEEVKEIISISASANKLSNIQKQAEEYAALIMEELDPDNLGFIMIHNLEMLLLQGPDESVRGESRNLSQMLSQKLKPTYDYNPVRRFYRDTIYFLLDNWQRVWVMALWIGAMCGLFSYKYIEYRQREDVFEVMGHCVCLAKGAAETLKLNMALILLPVCRNTITWLRNKIKLGVVPFDDNLNFHKVIAVGISIGVGIHGISHLACDFPRLLHATPDEYEPIEKYFGEQAKSYWHFVKHIEGVTGIIMVVLMAFAFTLATPMFRRGRMKLPKPLNKLTGFNAFWYSHHLFVIVYTLLIVHGIKLFLTKKWYKKTTWMYLAIPIFLYICERLTRLLRSSIEAVTIQKVAVYPGNVLALHMSRPRGFRYKSGQFIFVNCDVVSPFEWHPFSITSAPGDDYVSVHIRTLGDWTGQLRTVFSKVCKQPTNGKTQDYKKYEVVLLVGLGIGATPMISIVKDIVHNIRSMAEDEDEELSSALENAVAINNKTSSPSPPNPKRRENFKTKRAYFYWVTREQGSFDWFKGIMNEVAEMDHDHVIELHNYCTSVYEEGDARSALITMLQSLNHAKNGVDVVSGTRVKSHFAKPNWRGVYKHIAVNHNNARVGVFYCGAPALTKVLRQLASDFSHKTSTKFDFHKENF